MKGLIGSTYKATTTKDLQDKGQLAKIDIDCIILKYAKDSFKYTEKEPTKKFQEEINFLGTCPRRNQFIVDVALAQKDSNVLVLFSLVEKQGKPLFRIAEESVDGDKEVFFITGSTPVDERERIREYVESQKKNCVIFASSSVFATGTNIKNLHCIVFAHSFKSQIRVIQSIGRGLRVAEDKSRPTLLIDIVDDLSEGKKSRKNYVLNHAMDRLSYYNEEKWRYKIREFNDF